MTFEPTPTSIDLEGTLPTGARNAGLGDLVTILREQHARKEDMVVPASALRSEGALWRVQGGEAEISLDGVTSREATYRPTDVADDGIAGRLGIPRAYLRRMRDDRPDLYDANVNGWLHGNEAHREQGQPVGDPRSFLVRGFRGDEGQHGIARALLSDRYKIADNLDVLMAALDGVRNAGVEVDIAGADLTDRKMYVKINAPAIKELAPDLIGDYRSPFSGLRGADNPTVFAGFVISNSETGQGAFTITPRIVFEVCNNGMTITKDALRNVHIGGKLDEGVIRWSDETHQRNLDLVSSKTRDAVSTFLDTEYISRVLNRIRGEFGKPVEDAPAVVQHVAKTLSYGEDAAKGILDHFVAGGTLTAGGVMNAVTSYAQTVTDADKASEIEDSALQALSLAAA